MTDPSARILGAVTVALASLTAAVLVVWLRRPDTGLWLPVILAVIGCCTAATIASGLSLPLAELDVSMTGTEGAQR